MAQAAEVAGHGEHHADDAGLGGGVGNLPDLTLEGGDGGGVDHDTALAVLGFVGRHVEGLQPIEVERADEVQLNGAAEGVERVRAVLAQRALGGAATGGVDGDVQAAEHSDRVRQSRLGLGVVEDVHFVERATELLGHFRTGRRRQVEDGDVGTLSAEELGRSLGHARRPADDDGLLPLDLHVLSSLYLLVSGRCCLSSGSR